MKNSILFLFLALPFLSFSQGQITGITVDPANPTTSDFVRVYVDLSFSNGDCPLDNKGHTTNGNVTDAYSLHCMGMLTVICTTTDTFDLGYLQAGSHDFNYTLSSGFGGPGCSPGIVPDDSDSLSFTVTSTIGIEEKFADNISVYPNPSEGVLKLQIPDEMLNENMYFLITDLSGREILRQNIVSTNSSIELEHGGVYILRVFQGNTVCLNERLIIN